MPDAETDSANSAEIEARLQVVIARTAQDLSDANRTFLRKKIGHSLELRRGLRTVALQSSDEPAHGFDPAAAGSIQDENRR